MIDLSPQAYAFLADVVYRSSRIRLGPDRHAFVVGRLANRLLELRCPTFDDYCRLLDSPGGADESERLVELISTNHTHFFREPTHFQILARDVLPTVAPRAAASGRGLRIWCAAAASGEEAYSIAIMLAERPDLLPLGWTVQASDISRRMLERCRMGIYEADKVDLPDPRMLHRYFLRGFGDRDGYYRVKPALRRHVAVTWINLFQPQYPLPRGQDVIFCRNVMIYFDPESRQALVERLFDQLSPGGFLFIGHSESLLGLRHGFRQTGPSVYQRSP